MKVKIETPNQGRWVGRFGLGQSIFLQLFLDEGVDRVRIVVVRDRWFCFLEWLK